MPQSTLTVWKFNTPEGAQGAERTLEDMQKQGLITILDYAIVSWPQEKKKPNTKQGAPTTSAGALGGAFWGMLFGLIFFVPLLGAAVGAATGALAGSLSDVGIDDDFIRQVRDNVTPGTSALFVMSSNAVGDKVIDEFRNTGATLVSTNLSKDQEDKLREAFAD